MTVRFSVLLLCLSVLVSVVAGDNKTDGGSGYDTKYDSIDLNEMLANDRLRKNYVKCLLNEGPCTPDGQELKNSLPDAIATDCSKCSPKQKNGSVIVTHYLIDNQPDEWEQLASVYDKDGEYKRKYLESKLNEPTSNADSKLEENGSE